MHGGSLISVITEITIIKKTDLSSTQRRRFRLRAGGNIRKLLAVLNFYWLKPLMLRPNLFIVGSWKAGTSSLYHYLNAHPDIFMSPVKEPHYFVKHSRFRPRLFTRETSYLGLFRGGERARYRGEASAYYFSMPETPGLIHAFNPEARIIVLLRNPVEVIYAFHHESVFLGRETRNFEEALAYQAAHPGHVPNYLDLIRRWPAQLRAYQSHFGKDRVHVIIFDDLAGEPAAMYGRLLDFLGLDQSVQPEFRIHNPSKATPPRWFSALTASRLVVEVMRLCHLFPSLAIAIERFRHGQARFAARPPLDASTGQALAAAFAPTVDELSAMLGRDLSHWKTP